MTILREPECSRRYRGLIKDQRRHLFSLRNLTWLEFPCRLSHTESRSRGNFGIVVPFILSLFKSVAFLENNYFGNCRNPPGFPELNCHEKLKYSTQGISFPRRSWKDFGAQTEHCNSSRDRTGWRGRCSSAISSTQAPPRIRALTAILRLMSRRFLAFVTRPLRQACSVPTGFAVCGRLQCRRCSSCLYDGVPEAFDAAERRNRYTITAEGV